jgi:hypothetical protein
MKSMENLAQSIRSDLRNNPEALAKLAGGIESHLGEVHRVMPGGVNGKVGRIASFGQKLQGWELLGKEYRRDAAFINELHLREQLEKGFDGMDSRFKNLMERYGVDERAISGLSDVAKNQTEEGNRIYFTPELAQEMKGFPQAEKDAIQQKLQSYYVGEMVNMMHSSTLKTQMALEQPFGMKFQSGSLAYNANRIFQQFANYSIYSWKHPVQRLLHNTGTPLENLGSAVPRMLTAAGLGYLSLSLGSMAKGKEPLPVDSEHWLHTVGHSLSYGGFLGVYYDDLLDRLQRHTEGGMAEHLGGPLVGKTWKLMNGEMLKKDYWSLNNAEQTVLNNAPFINLDLFRLANNYMWRNQLENMLDPGRAARMEKYAKKAGTPYFSWAKPSIQFGGE